MIVNRLLYSRSFSKDYRWVMIPPAESPGDQEAIKRLLRQLNDEYDLYDRSKGLGSEHDAVLLFAKSIGGYGVLCRCGPTRYEDALGRRIFALTGLLVKHEEKKEFAAALPYLVALGEECLDIPVDLSTADTDHIKNSVCTQSIALDHLREKLPATVQEWLRMPHIQDMTAHELRTDDDGLKCLLRLLGSPLVPWVDFAFATPAQLARKMGNFAVVVGDVGLSVSKVEEVMAPRVRAPLHAVVTAQGPAGLEEKKGKRRSKPLLESRDSPPKRKQPSERQRGRQSPVLPDDFDVHPDADTDDNSDAVRIRAVADSSYLDRVLHRVYFRFEAYEAGGYVAAESERFRLSLNLERDHLAQREALKGLLEDLYDRGYVRSGTNDNDWSECVLHRTRKRTEARAR